MIKLNSVNKIHYLLIPACIICFSEMSHADGFTIDDIVVSNPYTPILDPEYDNIGHRLAYQATTNELWITDIDPVTGNLSNTDGKGQLLDTGLAPLATTYNGPEWAYGADGAFIVYTKLVNNVLRLAAANEVAPGIWDNYILNKSGNRFSPLGTLASNTGLAGIVYSVLSASGTVAQAYRSLNDSSTEKFIKGAKSRGARWSDDENTIITTLISDNVRQVATVDTITGDITIVSTGQHDKSLPAMWYAPDFGGQLVLARISNQIAGIYQDRGTGWEIINTIKLPSPRPFIHSLEPFVYNGKSYVVAIAADTISGNEYFPLQPTGPTDVWIAGIDRQNPFYRQVSVNNEQNKIDPEIVMLESGPAVYYTQMHPDKSIAVIRRALTGL